MDTKEVAVTNLFSEEIYAELLPKLMQKAELVCTEKRGYAPYPIQLYGVPRGGYVIAAMLVNRGIPSGMFAMVDDPEQADIIVDDIVDSGATLERYRKKYPKTPFIALVDKTDPESIFHGAGWITFPWERRDADQAETIEDNVRRLLQLIGEDANREGLRETPHRFAKAVKTWFGGYGKDPADVMKVFEDGAELVGEARDLVMVKDIPFYSHCEHHIAPIFGTVTIGYIPGTRIMGLSKFSRLVDIFARRLQVQERLTAQIAESLMANLSPVGVGVVIKARHLCMESRGISQTGSVTTTSALRGVFMNNADARAEFLELAK